MRLHRQFLLDHALTLTFSFVQLAVGGATADDSVVKSDVIDLITEVDAFDKYVQTNESTPWTSENALFTVSIGSAQRFISIPPHLT